MKFIRDFFRTPTASELAKIELAQAQRKLPEMQTCKEYAEAMVQYETKRVLRLEGFTKTSAA